MRDKSINSVNEAVHWVRDGYAVALGGFGLPGAPIHLMRALCETAVDGLEIIANSGGVAEWQLRSLMTQGRVRRVVASHIGGNKELIERVGRGEIELELIPQGTFTERLRAAGAGIPAFFTPTGVGTWVESGTPSRYNSDGSVAMRTPVKENRTFDGLDAVLELALVPDVSFVHAAIGDRYGNLVYSGSGRNFNPVMAMAGRKTIAEVEALVEPGEIAPGSVQTPGVYVDAVVEVGEGEKWHEKLITTDPADPDAGQAEEDVRHVIARRAAQDVADGDYVNLGIGIPTLIPQFLPAGAGVHIQSENGLVGIGPPPTVDTADPDLTNASKESTTLVPGGSISDSAEAFAMIRGGHIDTCVLGAMQVSRGGDLASWAVPGRAVSGMGGAMDLVAGADRVIVTMTHRDGSGTPKIVDECTYPLTGSAVVNRIVTDLAVLDVEAGGLILREVAPGVTTDDVRAATGADFEVASDLKTMSSGQPRA